MRGHPSTRPPAWHTPPHPDQRGGTPTLRAACHGGMIGHQRTLEPTAHRPPHPSGPHAVRSHGHVHPRPRLHRHLVVWYVYSRHVAAPFLRRPTLTLTLTLTVAARAHGPTLIARSRRARPPFSTTREQHHLYRRSQGHIVAPRLLYRGSGQVTNKPRFSLGFLAGGGSGIRPPLHHGCRAGAPPDDAPTLFTRSPSSESPVKTLKF